VLTSTIASSATASTGSHTWSSSLISAITPGTDYKIKICQYNSSTVCDESDDNFSIVGPVLVTSPNGGEEWSNSSSQTITWEATTSISKVKIYYVKGSGSAVSIDSNETNDGTYTWTIESTLAEAEDYKIKICDYYNSTVCDYSDDDFSIIGGTGDPIMVTFPNGNMSLASGYSQTITWAENISDTYVSIHLYKSGSWSSTITPSTPNDGNHIWTIDLALAEEDDYKIKICGTTNSSNCDESDNYFSIKPTGLTGTFSV
ncbi:uncharacterized protein METZ01_LOCUS446349, partial [marine metagenome]